MDLPLFSGYLFCRIDEQRFGPVLATPGVVQVVGTGAKPIPVADQEIEAIQKIVHSGEDAKPWPYLAAGQRVRLRSGALKEVEGILSSVDGRDHVVVNIQLLQRSVAVVVQKTDVELIWPL